MQKLQMDQVRCKPLKNSNKRKPSILDQELRNESKLKKMTSGEEKSLRKFKENRSKKEAKFKNVRA